MWERHPPYMQTFNQSPFQPHASPLIFAVSDQESENFRDIFWIKWILLSKALSNMASSSESVTASQFAVCLPKYVEVPCLMISYLPFSISLWIHTYTHIVCFVPLFSFYQGLESERRHICAINLPYLSLKWTC